MPPRHFTVHRRGPRLTLVTAGYGLLLFVWLGAEDSTAGPAIAAAAGLAVILALLLIVKHLSDRTFTEAAILQPAGFWGAVSGFLTGPLAVLLMLIKNSAHGHESPDYPLLMIKATLMRTPAWTVAGLLIGVGLGLLWLVPGNE